MSVSIASQLQVDLVLREAMRAFKRRVIPISLCSTVYRDVPLQGTDKVSVPYYPLVASGTTKDFAYGTGYVAANGTLSYKQITVNKRKYQPLELQSAEVNRQPLLDPAKLGMMMGERLAEDVVNDILSVVTAANFGAAVVTGAATSFDTDDVATIRTVCNQAMWPKGLAFRGLVLDSAYDGNLVKFLANYSQSGSTGVWQNGELSEVMGFRYTESPLVPTNAEGLVGFAINPSAILVAFAPVTPQPAIRAVMTDYRTYTDPDTGLTLEYREMGDAYADTTLRLIEANYGYAVGETAALKRITT